jgi:hypothetical protein
MIGLSLLLFFFAQAADAVRVPDAPETPGVYFRQDDSSWTRLKPAVASNANASGIRLFVDTGGYTDMGMSISCPGARALVRFFVPKPTLYIRAVGSEKDAMIVRLTKKKDKRVYKTSFSKVTVENKAGFSKGDIFKLIHQANPDGSFSVSPEKELPPGEYLLVLGSAESTYDFGIDPER